MRFGISATSLMCPKNLRTRLRPVNVCCAIVASRYRRLPSREDEPSEARPWRRPRVEFPSISKAGRANRGTLRPEFVLQTFKTQSDARGDLSHTARQIHLVTDCKSPKLPNLPTAYGGNAAAPRPQTALFVLPPPYGMAIMETRGASPRIPTLFCVRRPPGLPFARLLQRNPGTPPQPLRFFSP